MSDPRVSLHQFDEILHRRDATRRGQPPTGFDGKIIGGILCRAEGSPVDTSKWFYQRLDGHLSSSNAEGVCC